MHFPRSQPRKALLLPARHEMCQIAQQFPFSCCPNEIRPKSMENAPEIMPLLALTLTNESEKC